LCSVGYWLVDIWEGGENVYGHRLINMKTYNHLQKIVQTKLNLKIVIAFLIIAFYIFDFHFGVYLTPDSFAYLSGAKNLLSEQGFKYDYNNQLITVFPPFYSYFLIPFLKFGDLSSFGIIFSSILLFFISLFQLTKHLKIDFKTWNGLFLFFLICHLLFNYHNSVLSESLFIPLFISWFIFIEQDINNSKKLVVILALEVLLVSTRYSGIIIISAYYIIDFFYSLFFSKRGFKNSLFQAKYLVPIFTALYFLSFQIVLKSGSFIHFKNVYNDLDIGYSVYDYFEQTLSDIGDTVFGKMLSFQLQTYMLLIPLSILVLFFLYSVFLIKFKVKAIIYLFFLLIFHIVVLYNGAANDPLRGRLMFWFYIILICSVRLKIKECSFKKYLVFSYMLLIVLLTNDIYFIAKKIQYASENTYKGILYNNTYYSNQSYISTVEKQPVYIFDGVRKILVPPCYKWNL
jgi:hypothetical protein